VECGIAAVEDKRGSLASHHKSVDTGSDDEGVYPGVLSNLSVSLFDLQKQQRSSLKFGIGNLHKVQLWFVIYKCKRQSGV
jgi:hypothetical protein